MDVFDEVVTTAVYSECLPKSWSFPMASFDCHSSYESLSTSSSWSTSSSVQLSLVGRPESPLSTSGESLDSVDTYLTMPWREAEYPESLSVENLRKTSAWIRDVLDPLMAREGPHELHPDDVLTLHTIFLSLQKHKISLATICYSRIHLAAAEVCGKATRWPAKLADEADRVVAFFMSCYGPLEDIRTPLYERGGRLHGICEPSDLTRDSLRRRFSEDDPSHVDNTRAYFHGGLGFTSGHWWINGMLAFRDGIIDDKCTDGGICYNELGAYAIVLKDNDEINSPSPASFTYRCRASDKGRFRLTCADFRSRYPVRVLRSHTLSSLWSPRAGLRYDGVYRVVGWTIRPVNANENEGFNALFDVHFERDDENPFELMLRHPNSEEIDDYKAYKRCSREQRNAERRGAQRLNQHTANRLSTFDRTDFTEQFKRPSENLIEEYKEDRTHTLHRMEIVATDYEMGKPRTLDGLFEKHEDATNRKIDDIIMPLHGEPHHSQAKRTPFKKLRGWAAFDSLHDLTSRASRRDRSFDGSNEVEAPKYCSNTVKQAQQTPRMIPSLQHCYAQPAILTRFTDIDWDPPPPSRVIDWNPPPPPIVDVDTERVTDAFSHVALPQADGASEAAPSTTTRKESAGTLPKQNVGKLLLNSTSKSRTSARFLTAFWSNSPISPYPQDIDVAHTRPVLRGLFEDIRELEKTPENAAAFLQAQDRVWFDLEEAEYVDFVVEKPWVAYGTTMVSSARNS